MSTGQTSGRDLALQKLAEAKQRLSEKQKVSSASTRLPSSKGHRQYREADDYSKLDKTPAFKSRNYIEYDFSRLDDTKGGFIGDEGTEPQPGKDGLSLKEWKAKQAALSADPPMMFGDEIPKCWECDSEDLDYRFYRVFKCRVCKKCRAEKPDKYSLLTKTECRADYLLTDPELKDEDLLPHLERPNPYKNNFSNMLLYLRYQVEEFAFRKWGGPEALDAEYEKRVTAAKKRKERKFEEKLRDLRRKTRTQTITRKGEGKHDHDWSEPIEGSDPGIVQRRCVLCGFTTQEIVM